VQIFLVKNCANIFGQKLCILVKNCANIFVKIMPNIFVKIIANIFVKIIANIIVKIFANIFSNIIANIFVKIFTLTQFSSCASTGGRTECKPHLHVNLKIYQVLSIM